MQNIPDLISSSFRKPGIFCLKNLLCAGALLLLLSGSAHRAQAQRYSVTAVTPPAIPFVDPVIFFAGDMNNNGEVIGTTGDNSLYRAFAWSAVSGPTVLPYSLPLSFFSTYGYGVSDAGDYVGEDGYGRPTVYRNFTHTVRELITGYIPNTSLPGFVAPYFGRGQAFAATGGSGLVVGWAVPVPPNASAASGGNHAYAWPLGGDFIDMGGGPFDYSIARSINIHNHVAGEVQTGLIESGGATRLLVNGFVQNIDVVNSTFVATSKSLLSTLGGEQCAVRQINADDRVVGLAQTPAGVFHACLWTPTPAQFVVADLTPFDSLQSVANSINQAGVVVGQRNGNQGFIWDSVHGIRDLNTMIPDGWSCQSAIRINDNDQILADCMFNGSNFVVVLALQPTPTLAGLAPSAIPGATFVSPFIVTGTNFTASSRIHFHQTFPGNGVLDQDMPTTFDSATQLHTAIPSSLLVHTDNVTVTVLDPMRGRTGSQTLTITSGAIPTVISLTPDTVPMGVSVPKITVTGTNFKPASKIHLYQLTGFNGSIFTFTDQDMPTTFDSANQIHTSIPSSLLNLFSSAYLTVIDPVLGSSPGLTLNVVGVPKLSISSATVTRSGGPGSPISVLILFANTGTADAQNAIVNFANQLKLGGANALLATPAPIGTISNGQGVFLNFPGSILPGSRVLSVTMSYDGGSFSASKLVAVP